MSERNVKQNVLRLIKSNGDVMDGRRVSSRHDAAADVSWVRRAGGLRMASCVVMQHVYVSTRQINKSVQVEGGRLRLALFHSLTRLETIWAHSPVSSWFRTSHVNVVHDNTRETTSCQPAGVQHQCVLPSKRQFTTKSKSQTPPLTCRVIYLDQHVQFSKSHHHCC